jgi:hypothetical protein
MSMGPNSVLLLQPPTRSDRVSLVSSTAADVGHPPSAWNSAQVGLDLHERSGGGLPVTFLVKKEGMDTRVFANEARRLRPRPSTVLVPGHSTSAARATELG